MLDGTDEVQVLQDQAGKLLHTSNLYHNEFAGKLAERLVELTKSHDANSFNGAKVFFANSGTEANEGALKVARKVGKDRWAKATGKPSDDPSCDKYEIVCFENAFHGRSMGALSVTSNPKYQNPFKPLIPGVRVGKFNAQESIDDLISEKTCAVIVEPIQGEGGLHAARPDWLRALRKKCDEAGAVLIYDEIQVRGVVVISTRMNQGLTDVFAHLLGSADFTGLETFGRTLRSVQSAARILSRWLNRWRMVTRLAL
jgi:acetylornithine aminotransferase